MKALPERLAALLWPRRCPFCGTLLPPNAPEGCLCPACVPEAKRLSHDPPRLPETEHDFYALSGAASAFYYADTVRHAILLCKGHGHPWYARELADLVAVRVFGAEAASRPGRRPDYTAPGGLRPYTLIVPVPPRRPGTGSCICGWRARPRRSTGRCGRCCICSRGTGRRCCSSPTPAPAGGPPASRTRICSRSCGNSSERKTS